MVIQGDLVGRVRLVIAIESCLKLLALNLSLKISVAEEVFFINHTYHLEMWHI